MRPEEIEKESFRIIESEAGDHGFTLDQWNIVRRMIHATADFGYLSSVRFHPEAIESGIEAIKSGGKIVTDMEMVRSGINKKLLRPFGCEVLCFISDPEVASVSERDGRTRAESAVDLAVDVMKDGIYVIGNAPTALIRLLDLVDEGKAAPALIVGFPVGFVNAAESKERLSGYSCPYITNLGRRGGSSTAVSAMNALANLAAVR